MVRQPTFTRSAEALWQRTSRRTLVNAPTGRETFELSGISALVWEALVEPVTLDELVDDLTAVFDQPVTRVRSEVGKLLDDLVAEGVVLSM